MLFRSRLMCASELAATRAFMRGFKLEGGGFEKVAGTKGSAGFKAGGGWSDAESDVEDASEPLPRHLRV